MAVTRVLILVACAALTLASCKRREEADTSAPAAPPAAGAPAQATGPAGPLTYENATPHARVKLTLDPAVTAQPDLQVQLYGEGVRALRTFTEGALADRTEFSGDQGLPPYEKTSAWRVHQQTGKLMSLLRVDYENTGGAYPNFAYGSALWDKATRRRIERADLLKAGADMTGLDRALCEGLTAARRARLAEMAGPDAAGMETACPAWIDTPFVLAPSTTSGRSGGLIFIVMPGPHAEGPYAVVVPLSAFQGQLAPAYADEFAGAPIKTGDVTADLRLG